MAHTKAEEGAPQAAARPTVADLQGDSHFAQVARKHWLAAPEPPSTARPDVIKQALWDELEKADFAYSQLLVLENLQALERYLWPSFGDDASNYHALLLALIVNVKRRENLPSWGEHRRCAHHVNPRVLTRIQSTSQPTRNTSRPSSAASSP